jgi:AmmeMemoRadiSam system protein B
VVRKAAFAGRFYPGQADELTENIREFVQSSPDQKKQAIGIVVPHAGYMYSGHVAGAVYSKLRIPLRVIMLCPNHTGYGPPLSIMRSGRWQTPLGDAILDDELCEALMSFDSALEEDVTAHRWEHALEVQLPFLQYFLGTSMSFVPITIGTVKHDRLQALGTAIGRVVQQEGEPILIIASSDLNHYESDAITRVKDKKAIDRILALDGPGLLEVVRRENISMCGVGPAAAMLFAAAVLGASEAELVKYATSADTSGDIARVVGYAGIVVC